MAPITRGLPNVGITFISPTVYSNPVITSINSKPRLFIEKNAILLIVFGSQHLCVRTQNCNTIYAVTSPKHNQYMDDVHLADPRARDCAPFGQIYTVVMCAMGVSSSSCGSLEAIAQVGVPNIAVLTTRRDARTSVVDLPFALLHENVVY